MPGEDEHDICRRLESELCALREAVIANDVAAIEGHTAVAGELLAQLTPLLERGETVAIPERRYLHELTRNILVTLRKARRTVCALSAVYHFLSSSSSAQEPL